MSGPTTRPNTPNKEMSSGEGQRADLLHSMGMLQKKQSKHFSPSLGYRHQF
jgi:hypothetical protein